MAMPPFDARPIGWGVQVSYQAPLLSDMRTILLLSVLLCGCGVTLGNTESASLDPHWPPPQHGDRSVAAGCVLQDGVYRVSWHSDVVEKSRPAFSVTRMLTVAGDVMTLDDYHYQLDWIDEATANAWEPDDMDTLEFFVRRDCESARIRGSYTVRLPYYNPGHQVETWTLEAIK